ncbi:MAG: hypothetical protein K0S26_3068 [Bacteroidota bacterium]|jgi:hypothetical protein|nr:hypothetical protein [Bacteroidota bacterium]
MLELVALYFIFREAGRLAVEKGYSPVRWRIQAFLAWFFGEITGMFIVIAYFPNQIITMVIIGICSAYLSYLLLKQYWANLPLKLHDHD